MMGEAENTIFSLAETRRRILVALDVPTLPEALALVEALHPHVGGFKVGLELCTAEGPLHVVRSISAAGGSLFLDLKFKDIPNTVARSVRAILESAREGVRMMTLHCDGGSAMLRAAAEVVREHTAAAPGAPAPLLLGVTVLTSLEPAALSEELGIAEPLNAHVIRLARLAQQAGLAGVVASPREVAAIKRACGPRFVVVTPGVRPARAAASDQQRVMTPAEACQAGADYLVIGRPITAAPATEGGPAAAARRIAAEMAGPSA